MTTYAGIDIAKHGLDLAFEPKRKIRHFHNNAKGIEQCAKLLVQRQTELLQPVDTTSPSGGFPSGLSCRKEQSAKAQNHEPRADQPSTQPRMIA